jgi:hypothetical protein
MQIRKIFPGICLIVLCITGFMPTAQAALINSPSQPVDLQYNPPTDDTSGILPFSKLMRVKSDGTAVPFVLPSNQELVVTYVHLGISAVSPSLATNADLRMGPFYSRSQVMTNGGVSFADSLDPGFRITAGGFSNPLYNYFSVADLKNGGIIPGRITVRLVGYLAPAN